MADPCTKFEVSSVSRCGDITWGVKFYSILTLTTPLSGKIFHRQGGTCYGKSVYQTEVYRFTRYEFSKSYYINKTGFSFSFKTADIKILSTNYKHGRQLRYYIYTSRLPVINV